MDANSEINVVRCGSVNGDVIRLRRRNHDYRSSVLIGSRRRHNRMARRNIAENLGFARRCCRWITSRVQTD